MCMNKLLRVEHGTVRVACEVSFKVAESDYGTINVPAGTKVEKKVFQRTSHISGKVITSDTGWYVVDPAAICPDNFKINGKPAEAFIFDALNHGITVPTANITRKD